MLLRQYYLECLAQASYLVVDERSGRAVLVDPRRDVDVYLDEAARLGVRIERVILTHLHADFVAGHLELRERTRCAIHLGRGARAEFPFSPLAEGDEIELGSVRLSVLETPGHTPEAISLVVYDLARDGLRPHAVLTGDTLFVGDVGRPDLLAAAGASADAMARALFRSLHQKLLALPDATLVYPGHGPGSLCGRSLGPETVSTIGAQRRENAALRAPTEEAFVMMVTADQPVAPAYFARAAALNRTARPLLDEVLHCALTPLSLDDVLALRAEDAQLLDVRDPPAFAAGHLTGSVNIGLSGKLATWAGTLLDPDRPIVLVAEPGREKEAAVRLARVGFHDIRGHLAGEVAAVCPPQHVRLTARLSCDELARRLASDQPPLVLDVRSGPERDRRHIGGSVHVPLNQLLGRLQELPLDRNVVAVCESGFRSCIAASLLERAGAASVSDLARRHGGLEAD